MNKVSTRHIRLTVTLTMLMMASAAMAQRSDDPPAPEPPVAEPKVIVGGSVFGGGNLAAVGGNTSVTINQVGSQVGTDVYGGGALADVGTSTSNTTVTLTNGKVLGDVYGGGLGDNTTPAMVNGNVAVVVNQGVVSIGGSVFGCNNVKGTPKGTVTVTINGSASSTITEGVKNYAIGGVYGGGNLAHYDPTTSGSYPTVTVNGCTTSIRDVYGGGNAAAVPYTSVTINGGDIDRVFAGGNGESGTPAHVGWKNTVDDPTSTSDNYGVGTALATIHGGTINQVFSGSNSKGVIRATMGVNVSKVGNCAIQVGELYGGGNEAPSQPGNIAVGCMDENDMIDNLYGGANDANVTGNITLNITKGRIGNVFGGNNTGHSVIGTITVNINKDDNADCANDWYVGNVYGGGNHAPYGSTPDVNIINGTVSGSVYGGGNQAGVAGGDVAMTGGAVRGGVYGGCNTSGVVGGDITVNITAGTVGTSATQRADVFGGGYGEDTSVTGNVTVNIGEATASTPNEASASPTIYGDVYGGSAHGSVNTNSSNKTIVNILNGTLASNVVTENNFPVYYGGNVFGGGLGVAGAANVTKGQVNGVVEVNIGAPAQGEGRVLNPENDDNIGNATIGGNVYGCNNTNGSPKDNVTVNIYRTYRSDAQQITGTTYAIPNVFGGGNQANYLPLTSGKKLQVAIHGCYNTVERVFGGSNAAAAGTSTITTEVNTSIDGGRFYDVFGGGNGEVSAADIFGDVKLFIHGGHVEEFFVGSNQNGTVSGNSNVTVDQSSGCEDVVISEFFCGGKYADFVGDINATINCSDGMHVTELYGGCKEADVYGNVHLTVKGGSYDFVYGGSKGRIPAAGATQEELEKASADILPYTQEIITEHELPQSLLGTGGNVTLDINGGTVSNAIFGGSNVNGKIAGTITVNVEKKTGTDYCDLDVSLSDVYGGGNQANYYPTQSGTEDYPQVNIKNATVKNVFGGGLNAEVTGNPQVQLKNKATILGNVYGGGNMGEVNGNPKVILNGKQTN